MVIYLLIGLIIEILDDEKTMESDFKAARKIIGKGTFTNILAAITIISCIGLGAVIWPYTLMVKLCKKL